MFSDENGERRRNFEGKRCLSVPNRSCKAQEPHRPDNGSASRRKARMPLGSAHTTSSRKFTRRHMPTRTARAGRSMAATVASLVVQELVDADADVVCLQEAQRGPSRRTSNRR